MEYRQVGQTGVRLSVVGMGTAQLQMVSERQAVDTLRRGFEHGINWVHTAPDYGSVEPWIARAIRESGAEVVVATQSTASLAQLDPFFNHAAATFGRPHLDLYGVNCIDDIERLGEDVWGPDGMVASLQRKKKEGRLRALFCSTRGTADYVCRLIESGAFDAVMVAYNPIEFHLLSYFAARDGRAFEKLSEYREKVFPLAERCGVSLLVMKALGGGLLTRGRAFPPHQWFGGDDVLPAADLLKFALSLPAVFAVVPGVAAPEEAEANARAGRAPLALSEKRREEMVATAQRMRLSLCSRCGECEATCSQSLRIASMFRDAYLWSYRSETFMYHEPDNYFDLVPGALACATCTNQTCLCPQGLHVPAALARVHETMVRLREEGGHPGETSAIHAREIRGAHALRVIHAEVVTEAGGTRMVARFFLHNVGSQMWMCLAHARDPRLATGVVVRVNGRAHAVAPLRQNFSPDERGYAVVECDAPAGPGPLHVEFSLRAIEADAGAPETMFAGVMMPGAQQ
jgi:hypothetical protein